MAGLLDRWRILIMLILVLITVSGLAVLYGQWPRVSPITVTTPDPGTAGTALKVYVSGAVVRPGVYGFQEGDRVEDAVKAAGGPTADADMARLNLAQRLRDEGQVIVPRLGETPVASVSDRAPSSGQSRKIDINTASAAELDALPGIGATYAQRIIEYRIRNGPFQKIEDLKDKKIIPAATFEKIKDLIDVK